MSRTEAMRELFARWHSSGLSLLAFGKQEGVSYAKLLYWKKKFEREALEQDKALANGARSDLVPITVVPDPATQPAAPPARFDVWLTNGVCLEVAAGFDERELRRLVRVLQAC